MSVLEMIKKQKELADRWRARAHKIRERAQAMPEGNVSRELMIMHALGIEESVQDLELSIFFNEKKMEALTGGVS